MEKVKEKIEKLYLELSYVRLEWTLMKEIDDKINYCSEKMISRNEELIFSLNDSLWYSIIMRIAKICEDNTQVDSIYKIFNCCDSNPNIVKKNIITKEELSEMRLKVKTIINDESEENINLIKGWRDNYLAHYSKLKTPQTIQEEYLITRNKLDNIIEILLNIIIKLMEKFKIEIDDIYMKAKIQALKNEFNYIYNILEISINL